MADPIGLLLLVIAATDIMMIQKLLSKNGSGLFMAWDETNQKQKSALCISTFDYLQRVGRDGRNQNQFHAFPLAVLFLFLPPAGDDGLNKYSYMTL